MQSGDIQTAGIHGSNDRGPHWNIFPYSEYHISRFVGIDFSSSTTRFAEHYVGNSTYAGATAALMANVVLIAYVIVAMKEDEGDKKATEDKARKGE